MSESNTPRADELGRKLGMKPDESYADKLPVHAFWTAIELCRELERELAEAKAELNRWKDLTIYGAHPENIFNYVKSLQNTNILLGEELSAIKEQKRNGELMYAEDVISWFALEKPLTPRLHEKFTKELKQVAAERAKEQP